MRRKKKVCEIWWYFINFDSLVWFGRELVWLSTKWEGRGVGLWLGAKLALEIVIALRFVLKFRISINQLVKRGCINHHL